MLILMKLMNIQNKWQNALNLGELFCDKLRLDDQKLIYYN